MKTFLSILIILFVASTTMATPPVFYQYQQVVVPQKVVQFDQAYFQGINGYYSVADKIKAEKQEEKNVEIEFYKGQIDMLLKILANKNSGDKPIVVTPEQPETPPPAPQPQPNTPTSDYKVTEVDKQVYNIIKAKCAKCHGDTKQDGELALIKNDTLQLVDIYDRVDIFDRVSGIGLQARNKTRMPKGSPALSDVEVESFRLWMIQESDLHR